MTPALLLYVIALVLLLCAAFNANPPRVSLGWLALAIVLFAAVVLPAIA